MQVDLPAPQAAGLPQTRALQESSDKTSENGSTAQEVAPPILGASLGGPLSTSNMDNTSSPRPSSIPPKVTNAGQAPPTTAVTSANPAEVVRLYTSAAEAAKSSSLQAANKTFPTIPPPPQPRSGRQSVPSGVSNSANKPPVLPQLDTRSPLEKRGWAPPPVQMHLPGRLPGGDQPFRFPKVAPPLPPHGMVPTQDAPPRAKRGRPRKDAAATATPSTPPVPELPSVGGANLGWPATQQPPPPAPVEVPSALPQGTAPSLGGGLAGQQPQPAGPPLHQAALHATPPQQSSLPNVLFAEWYIQRLGWLANALMNRPRPKEEVRDVPCGIFLTALENDGILRVQNDLNLKSFSHVVGAIGSGTLLDDILRSHTAIVVDMLQRQESERKEALELMTRAQEKIAHLEMELRTATYKLASEQEVTKRLMNALKSVQGVGLTEAQQSALTGTINHPDNQGQKRGYPGASGVVEIVDLDPEVVGVKRGRGRPRKDDPTAPSRLANLPRLGGSAANPVANKTPATSALPAATTAPMTTNATPVAGSVGSQPAAGAGGVAPTQNPPPPSTEPANPQPASSNPISSTTAETPSIAPPPTTAQLETAPLLPPTTSGGLLSLAPAPPLFAPVAPSITSAALANIAPVPPFTGIPPTSFELPERTTVALSNGRGPRMTSFFDLPERLSVEEAARRAALPSAFAVPEKTSVEEATRAATAPLTEEALEALRAGFVLPERVSLSQRSKSGTVLDGAKSGGADVEMREATSGAVGGAEQGRKEAEDEEMAEAGEGDVAAAPAGGSMEENESGARVPEIGVAPGGSSNERAMESEAPVASVGEAATAGGVPPVAVANDVGAEGAAPENKAPQLDPGEGGTIAGGAEALHLDGTEGTDSPADEVAEVAGESTRRTRAPQKEAGKSPEKSTERPSEVTLTPLRRSGRHK